MPFARRDHVLRQVAANNVGAEPHLPYRTPLAIADRTADFAYLRCKQSVPGEPTGYSPEGIDRIARLCRAWEKGEAPAGLPYAGDPEDSRGKGGDVFAFMIAGAKERAPAAAMALAERLKG